ncbi:hypothetical protein [Dyadobacter jejuensis]|uniref:hypothetical protein n=1 Tax=Dyadobacter jejuensis TaxID=1082580 RepID=UPI000D6D8D52|nr:hypothetical protein [Dyadobacter jejuensis]
MYIYPFIGFNFVWGHCCLCLPPSAFAFAFDFAQASAPTRRLNGAETSGVETSNTTKLPFAFAFAFCLRLRSGIGSGVGIESALVRIHHGVRLK